MTPDYLAAPRDASSFDRPDTRSTKVFHACDAGALHSSGQRWGQRHRLLAAVCSQQVLDDHSAIQLNEVPQHLRCRRAACARIWRQHDQATPGTAHSAPASAEQNEKGTDMNESTQHEQPPIIFVVDEAAGVFGPSPASSSRGATELVDDLIHELRALPRSTRRLPPSSPWRASASMAGDRQWLGGEQA